MVAGPAQIIPFPSRPRVPSDPDRLATALANLAAALAKQRQAVATWRSALADLGVEVRATETSLLGHLGHLGVLHEGIAKLHENACLLQQWADRAEVPARHADTVLRAPFTPQTERHAIP